jgi:ubiquitin carboxyl-terminal hydrolase 4/11/15
MFHSQSRVAPVSNIDDIKTPAAYLLFYVRRTSKPIGGKTHEILASKTVTPAMSAYGSGSRPASPPPYESSGVDSTMLRDNGKLPLEC